MFAALPAALSASGFQLVEQNASGLGNAFAGQAAGVEDASAVYFNPAALTRIKGLQIVVSTEPIGVATEFVDSGSRGPALPFGTAAFLPVPLGGAGGDAGGWVPVPNAYASWQAAERWWIGLGVNAPFGLATEWDPSWVGRFHAVESEVRTLNVNPTVAFKVTDGFSLGAGASLQRLEATLSQSVPYGGIAVAAAAVAAGPAAAAGILAQLGGAPGLAREGLARVEGDDTSWGWNVGARLALGEGSLAASYRSKVTHELQGDATFEGAPVFSVTGPLGALGTGINARFASGPAGTEVTLPDTLSVAAAYQMGKAEVLADWTWTGWSSVQTLSITRADGAALSSVPLRFEDTWRAGLGLNYGLNETWLVRLGTAYDKTPVQDEFRTPRLPDTDRIWAAAGFQWRLSKTATIDLGYAHLFLDEAESALPNQDSAQAPPRGDLLGSYEAKVDILGLQLRLSF
jgi:long-chain fatty acid transport protein